MIDKLYIPAPEAKPEEIERGLAAAYEVLKERNLVAEQAAWGFFNRERAASAGDYEAASNEDYERAEIWEDMQMAAIEACCKDWPEQPENYIVNLDTPEIRESLINGTW